MLSRRHVAILLPPDNQTITSKEHRNTFNRTNKVTEFFVVLSEVSDEVSDEV